MVKKEDLASYPIGVAPFGVYSRLLKNHDGSSRLERISLADWNAIAFHLARLLVLKRSLDQGLKDLIPLFSVLFNNAPIRAVFPPLLHFPGVGLVPDDSSLVRHYSKLRPKRQYPNNLGAIRFHLADHLIHGDEDALINNIRILKQHQSPVFAEFYSYFEASWELVKKWYWDEYQRNLPDWHWLQDEYGYVRHERFATLFGDNHFLVHCLMRLINPPHNDSFCPRYGLGLLTLFRGRFDIVVELILNENPHPVDILFLSHFLSNMVKMGVDYDEVSADLLARLFSVIQYLSQLGNEASDFILSSSTDPDACFKMRVFTKCELNFIFSLFSDHLSVKRDWICSFVGSDGGLPQVGQACLIRVFQPERLDRSLESGLQLAQGLALMGGWRHIFDLHLWEKRSFLPKQFDLYSIPENRTLEEHLAQPWLKYIINLLLQVPAAQWQLHEGQVGMILRSMFPGIRLEPLNISLTPEQQKLAASLLNSHPHELIPHAIQTRHFFSLLQDSFLAPQGFLSVMNPLSRPFYAGGNIGFQLTQVAALPKDGIQRQLQSWQQLFQLYPFKHPLFDELEYLPLLDLSNTGRRRGLYITPGTAAVRRLKSQYSFLPVYTDNQQGLYCHLEMKTAKQGIGKVASGCCLFGSALIAIGQQSGVAYPLLTQRQSDFQERISAFAVTHQEHPEELIFLSIQATMAPFYAGVCQEFVLHDVRFAYYMYLLPYYFNEQMSTELWCQGKTLIDERFQRLFGQLKAIMKAHEINCTAFSSLQLAEAFFNEEQLASYMVYPREERMQRWTWDVLSYLCYQPHHTRVSDAYAYCLGEQLGSIKAQLIDKSDQPVGPALLSKLDFVLQFAILNDNEQQTLLVSLLSIESKLLESYSKLFSQRFGSVASLLILAPLLLNQRSLNYRWYYLPNSEITDACALVNDCMPSLQTMIAAIARDEPGAYIDAVRCVSSVVRNRNTFFGRLSKNHIESCAENGIQITL
ncbi:hypothetical protein [Legionella shakespearei]|uniref:Uncharacterized protein n=1 Tax=Legionella shakespearei DSM 23087 TaxID=1122169 RepID=A0A0W0YM93_9GAMM|nr:hypothetical protein [Legionella shakespearei]KTD57654.1 hypothetical protein Lsha_2495 [Legionella shakespearei DSM 23087]